MGKRLELLDYGRLAAALSVMAFHYLFNGVHNGKIATLSLVPALADVAKYGYLGVEFFFLISGYVIFASAREKSPGQFATSRAVRLFPAFWFAVLFTSAFACVWGAGVTVWRALANLTMMPLRLGALPVDAVYWSLQQELQFYGAVLVCLVFGLRTHLDRIFIAWPALMLVAFALGRPDLPLLGGYYPFFAAGALFAIARDRLSVAVVASLAVAFFLALVTSLGQGTAAAEVKGVPYSAGVIIAIIAAQFAFFFVLNTHRGQSLRLPGSRLAGGLTYPIYLIHASVGYMLLSRFATEPHKALAYVLVAAFVFASAYAIHTLVEVRPRRAWHALFERTVGRLFDAIAMWVAGWYPAARAS